MSERPAPPQRSAPTLVALRALGLGDFLCGVPAYRALARAFPHHHRILALPCPLHPLVSLLDGAFDESIAVGPLEPLPPSLGAVDVAVNLHGRGPQSHRILLDAKPRWLIAFAHRDVPQSARGPRWDSEEHERLRWCRLLTQAGIAADPAALSLPRPVAAASRLPADAVVLHPGAASAARRWPAARWAATAGALAAEGLTVLLTGSSAERVLCREIATQAQTATVVDLAGETTLLELALLVAKARCLISGDTGIAHLASAYGTPSVVLFGPTPPGTWGPPERPQHRVLWSGSVGDPHGKTADAGLLALTVADVLAAARQLLEHARPEPKGKQV